MVYNAFSLVITDEALKVRDTMGENNMTENVRKTEAFIKEKFLSGDNKDKFDWIYRYEHSLRTAGIGQRIAKEEGLEEEALVIACLLHDIGYINCKSKEDHDIHGRLSEILAREFLDSIGYDPELRDTICYGIRIHTEPEENYERRPTPFEMSISDADDIDRFDAYRLYSNLRYVNDIDHMSPSQMLEVSAQRIERYEKYINMERGTKAATTMWREVLELQIKYYKHLRKQMGTMESFCQEIGIEKLRDTDVL